MKVNGAASILLLSLCLTLSSAGPVSAKEWRGIVPLRSTRADVERLLGPAPDKDADKYVLRDEIVSIHYARFPCGHTPPEGWPVPPPGWKVSKDTVVAVRVALRKPVPLAELNVDLSGYRKSGGGGDVPQFQSYDDGKVGHSIEVFESLEGKGGVVMAHVYYPTAAEEKSFRCEEPEQP